MRASTRKLAVISAFLFMTTLISLQSIFVHQVSASPVAKINVDPTSQSVSSSFTVDITVTDVSDFYSWEFRLNYSTSIITSTGVTEGPFLKLGPDRFLWVSDNDDFIYKTYLSDPSTSIVSWDTGTSRPYGVEYVNGFIYYVDFATDTLYNKTLAGGNGSPASWDISGYVNVAYGLGWNGTHFLIADRTNNVIYFADPANPTVSVKSITYTGVSNPEAVTFDGTYIWVGDVGTSTVYKLNANTGAIQDSWDPGIGDPNGITWDGTYLWIANASAVTKCDTDGNIKASFTAPSTASEGLSSGEILPSSPRSTTFFVTENSDANGRVWVSASLVGDIGGVAGSGVIATINFDIDSSGTSDLDLHTTRLVRYDVALKKTFLLTHAPVDGSVTTSGVPEFPLGAAAEIGIIAVVFYVWWRKRKTKLSSSAISPR